MADRKTLELLTKKLADEGKLIEAGWVALRAACVPLDAPPVQIESMRLAFMAGADHLFASMLSIQDEGDEPTDDDMDRMNLINEELESWRQTLETWVSKPEGQA